MEIIAINIEKDINLFGFLLSTAWNSHISKLSRYELWHFGMKKYLSLLPVISY